MKIIWFKYENSLLHCIANTNSVVMVLRICHKLLEEWSQKLPWFVCNPLYIWARKQVHIQSHQPSSSPSFQFLQFAVSSHNVDPWLVHWYCSQYWPLKIMPDKLCAVLQWYGDICHRKENLKSHLAGAQFLHAGPEFDFCR